PGAPGPGAAGYQYAGPAGAPAGPPKEALAGFWIRFVGALLDGIILSVVAWVVASLLGVDTTNSSSVSTLLGLVYFTYFHATIAGQTVGNRLVGIRIADATSGGPIPYSRAFIRYLMSIVSAIPLALGYLWMLWDDRRQTWHDKVASTLVVRTSYYPPPGDFGKPQSS
ncbi:MAG: hypothetical protein GEU81_06300, partial [Nitriliruptorales bacterium]|nr:hypothetical protein [Nitriliruptorales bacterium]